MRPRRAPARALRAAALWALCAAALWAASPGVAAAQEPPPTAVETAVETAVVEARVVDDEVAAVGSLRANESVVIRPEIGGRIVRIGFTEGTAVKEGDLLYALDDTIYRAELAQARASLNLSQSNFDRAKELLTKGAGTTRARDEAQAKFVNDQAAVELAQARLAKMRISAPFDGLIGLRRVSVGDYVQTGQDLVDLANIDPIKVDFRVPERYLAALRVGQRLSIRVDAFPDREFAGEVYALSPEVDPQGRSIAIRATVPNQDRQLRPGLFARVRLVVASRPGAVTVPEQAIVPRGDERYVYKVIDGVAKLTAIRLGKRAAGWVEVVSGLNRGDVVVTAGQIKLQDGAPVRGVPTAGEAGG